MSELTQITKIEERLRVSEERFRRLIETVQDYAIFLLDEKGFISSWNVGAERLKGYRVDEIIGQHFSKFYPEVDRISRKPDIELEIAAREGKCIDEGWRIRKDGSRFWAYVVITALRENDRLIGFSKVTRDLTERKLAENILQNANLELENKVRQRTVELLEKNKDLEQFAYIASHDLQEPLRKIIAFSERLAEEGSTEKRKSHIEKITKSALRMRSIIQDLLDYSRLASEKLPMERTDLRTLLDEVFADIEHRILQSGARVEAGRLPTLVVNPTAIRHLFQNLLLNSIKFARPGIPPIVSIDFEIRLDGAEIRVRDNGIGFDQKYADEIFKPFRRLHSKEEYEGTGIGLSLCQKIAHQHGGRITAFGRVGHGATFVLTLPSAACP